MLVSPGLALLLQGLVSLTMETLQVFSLAGSGPLSAFTCHALRRPTTALIDLRLFRAKTFELRGTQFLSNAINFGGQLLMPLYFLKLRGLPPSMDGITDRTDGIRRIFSRFRSWGG